MDLPDPDSQIVCKSFSLNLVGFCYIIITYVRTYVQKLHKIEMLTFNLLPYNQIITDSLMYVHMAYAQTNSTIIWLLI